jgi:hypothetical protein
MLAHVCCLYGFNLNYAKTLVGDLSADQMVEQPGGLVNHPAWSLGHLCVSASHLATLLGRESTLPDGWTDTFKTGGVPGGGLVADYPTKDQLVTMLAALHERAVEALKATDPADLEKPHPNEGARKYFPTVGDMAIFLMTGHEMDHLGQIAAWRRAMGLGSATGV